MDSEFYISPNCYSYDSLDAEIVVYDTDDNRTLLLTDFLAIIYDNIRALENSPHFSADLLSNKLQADSNKFELASLHQGLEQLLELKLIKHA